MIEKNTANMGNLHFVKSLINVSDFKEVRVILSVLYKHEFWRIMNDLFQNAVDLLDLGCEYRKLPK